MKQAWLVAYVLLAGACTRQLDDEIEALEAAPNSTAHAKAPDAGGSDAANTEHAVQLTDSAVMVADGGASGGAQATAPVGTSPGTSASGTPLQAPGTALDAGPAEIQTAERPDATAQASGEPPPSETADAGAPDASAPAAFPSASVSADDSASPSAAPSTSQSTSAAVSASASAATQLEALEAQRLFNQEEFGGNGRTCLTCHGAATGTIDPAEVEALYAADPTGPLFRPIDSNDGIADDYSRLREHATMRVAIPLPAGVTLTQSPSATAVVVHRSVPSTLNTPALDSVLMWDGRAEDLLAQALDAIQGHSQATLTPSAHQLTLISQFEQSESFFSSDALRQYSQGGPPPQLPEGNTESEIRGRVFFQDSASGLCLHCHGGPMLNETTAGSEFGAGTRLQSVSVSEFNDQGNPTYEFAFADPNAPNGSIKVTTPDPGRALITGNVLDVNKFKIPTLWGIKNTAPYFHDNSANTLEGMMDHYQAFFEPTTPISDQDKADIIAYLKLL
jgi:cytochrome c peroxidase